MLVLIFKPFSTGDTSSFSLTEFCNSPTIYELVLIIFFKFLFHFIIFHFDFCFRPARVPSFNAPVLTAPPVPPDVIVTDQDRQAQILYERWLNEQNNIYTQQQKYYDTEVQKLRKKKKVSGISV